MTSAVPPNSLLAEAVTAGVERARIHPVAPSTKLPGVARNAIALPPLPAASGRTRSLAEVVDARRSGTLASGAPNAADLHALLRAGDPQCLFGDAMDDFAPPLLMPLLWQTSGLPPGAYRHDARAGCLLPIVLSAPVESLRDCFLQLEHRRAGAIVLIVVQMRAWLARAGARGYRAATIQAGMVCDALYLEAEYLGLTYSASGGFSPPVLEQALGLDGLDLAVALAFVVGGPCR